MILWNEDIHYKKNGGSKEVRERKKTFKKIQFLKHGNTISAKILIVLNNGRNIMNFNITISAESEGGVKKESTLSLKFFVKMKELAI